jgi:crotonobetainyl-CoA:carnitine CoA-transferase CaiB-like acyl-CoA transferase
LIDALAAIFRSRAAAEWERDLLSRGIACVAVNTDSIESMLFDDAFGRASGFVVEVTHPVFDDHPRLAPYVRFSRTRTQALPGVLAGQQTDEILAGIGRTADEIADLRVRGIVA